MSEQDDPVECDSCHAQGIELQAYQTFSASYLGKQGIKSMTLCALCAGTQAGNAYQYPEQYRGQEATLRTICYIGNEILKALRKGGPHA